ncbi:hypothetical protein IJ101_00690 [Candidatus Saccharibacteria bacterium]|nr:hypothetical protein [Candidatus Saccharibacteria bacterium]
MSNPEKPAEPEYTVNWGLLDDISRPIKGEKPSGKQPEQPAERPEQPAEQPEQAAQPEEALEQPEQSADNSENEEARRQKAIEEVMAQIAIAEKNGHTTEEILGVIESSDNTKAERKKAPRESMIKKILSSFKGHLFSKQSRPRPTREKNWHFGDPINTWDPESGLFINVVEQSHAAEEPEEEMPVMSKRSEKITTPESVGDNAQHSEESAEKSEMEESHDEAPDEEPDEEESHEGESEVPEETEDNEKAEKPEEAKKNDEKHEEVKEAAEKEAEKEDNNKEKSEKNDHKIGDRLIESCTEVFGGDRKLQRKLLEVLDVIENDENYRGENDSRIWSLEDDITLRNRERFEKRIDILLGNVAEN